MNKSIYIPFQNYNSVGGPSTFMGNLQTYLDQINYQYIRNPEHAKAIFFPIAYPKEDLQKIKERGGLIIQRLDGIYYPTKHGKRYKQQNAPIKEIYKNFTDFVIFQSEYSKKQCFKMLGKTPENRYQIIINGVDKSMFYPNPNVSMPDGLFRIVTTGNFRNIDMIEPVAQALDQLSLKFELTVIGPVTNDALKPFLNRPYVNYLGSLSLQEIAVVLREQHLFVYAHLNPPCPNSVLEAVSTGLPVVGFNSGAMEELLFFSKDLLAPVVNKLFQEYRDFDYQELQQKIQLAMNHYREWRAKALAHSHLYSFESCGRAYTDTFQRALSQPSRTPRSVFKRIIDRLFTIN